MSTVPGLSEKDYIADTDLLLVTESDGTGKKCKGANVTSYGTNSIIATNTTIVGPKLKTGLNIKILFTQAITGSNTTSALSLSYNGDTVTVKVNFNGNLKNFTAVYINSTYTYLMAQTTLELIYNGSNFVIVGNPIVYKDYDTTILADGSVAGDPIGTIVAYYKNAAPYGWLPLEGQDTSAAGSPIAQLDVAYPGLYAFLGNSNVLPDLRECALVGIGQNGTNTIATHDTYTLGQFKDDQIQTHSHSIEAGGVTARISFPGQSAYGYSIEASNLNSAAVINTPISAGRNGTTTRGKRKGVKYLIKAL